MTNVPLTLNTANKLTCVTYDTKYFLKNEHMIGRSDVFVYNTHSLVYNHLHNNLWDTENETFTLHPVRHVPLLWQHLSLSKQYDHMWLHLNQYHPGSQTNVEITKIIIGKAMLTVTWHCLVFAIFVSLLCISTKQNHIIIVSVKLMISYYIHTCFAQDPLVSWSTSIQAASICMEAIVLFKALSTSIFAVLSKCSTVTH